MLLTMCLLATTGYSRKLFLALYETELYPGSTICKHLNDYIDNMYHAKYNNACNQLKTINTSAQYYVVL